MIDVQFYPEAKFGTNAARGLHLKTPSQAELTDAMERAGRDNVDVLHLYSDTWACLQGRQWRRPGSYMGPQYFGYVALAGQSRDSDALERSNFEAISDDVHATLAGGADLDEDTPLLETASASHWAVGWVETVMVGCWSVAALNFAASVVTALDDYPVYDESHFSETEAEEAAETCANYASEFQRELACFLEMNRDATAFANETHVADVVSLLFDEAASYSGLSDAWISAGSLPRLIQATRWQLSRAVRADRNIVALRLLRKAGVRMTSDRKSS